MNTRINPAKAGTALGALFGGIHVAWSLLVAFGWAEPLLDFVLWAHMVNIPIVVRPFDLAASVTLIIITTIIRYVAGYLYATLWNRIHKGV